MPINTFQTIIFTPVGLCSPISDLLFIMAKNVKYAIGSSMAPNVDAMIISQVFEVPAQIHGHAVPTPPAIK